ncbi:unnamed protein product [Durusdinium trenchii]|uniref:Uncharacterized protein n=1 Tax=Durusdinium trenchii TaxID=1381693 RepID=A0ABP0KW66_9DINO
MPKPLTGEVDRGGPKKERPSPLPDSFFSKEDIPVHNTFIQFDSPSVEDEKTLATAPAWIGPSLQSIVQAEQKKDSVPAETEPSVEGEAMEPISVPTPVTAEAARQMQVTDMGNLCSLEESGFGEMLA